MPTYEYKCSACGHAFEQFQSMTAPPVKRCPQCGKAKVKRLLGTGAGVIFKGSGFYTTDYRDANYKERAKAESGASGNGQAEAKPATESQAADSKPAEAKSESKSESKPAAGSDKPAAAPKSPGKSEKKSKK
jgi:putative FmdB family regulatory protein